MSEDLTYDGQTWTLPDDVVDRLSGPTTGKGRMQRIALGALLAHRDADELPTSGRFIFYELEQRGHVRKSRRGESRRGTADDPREQELIDALGWLRRHEVVPWNWIVDESRTLFPAVRTADSVADYLTDSVDRARLNPWGTVPPLVLCESRSLAGVLRAMMGNYRVGFAATNGQAGGFLRTEIAPELDGNDRPVLYLGDLDHQGAQIEANTRDVLERETGREIPWTRVAITEDQLGELRERGLEATVKEDGRYRDDSPDRVSEAWETEALGQSTIVELVREALDELLPEPLDDVLEREARERDEWLTRIEGLS